MTDRPIIFSASMVKALLEGRKSQTRRVLKLPTRTHSGGPIYERPDMGGWAATTIGGGGCFTVGRDGRRLPVPERPAIWHQTTGVVMALPFDVGDRLWVREAHAFDSVLVRYYATDDVHELRKKRSPIHMPRWASRLTLTVTDVRVQRLQEISEADAVAEGATMRPMCHGWKSLRSGWSMNWSRVGTLSRWASVPLGSPKLNPLKESDISLGCAQMAYASYWNDLHGPDAWAANPWICALTFTVSRGNIDAGGDA